MEEILKTFTLSPLDAVMIIASCPLFFIFWQILDKVCFSYFLNLNGEREDATEGRIGHSVEIRKKAQHLSDAYEHSINEAREMYSKKKDAQLEIARKEASEIIATAMNEAETIIVEGKNSNQKLLTKALSDLQHESEKLTASIIDKVVALSL